MRRSDQGRIAAPHEDRPKRHRARLLASSAGLLAVPVAALALAASLGSIDHADLSATEVRTEAPATTDTVAAGREPVPAPQRIIVTKGVAVVAPPTTTTSTAPPPTTAAPAPAPVESAPEPEPDPVDEPDPVTVTTAPPAPAPRPTPPPAPSGSVSANLDAIARCESGGNPDAYNPAGYYGAFQFSLATWQGLGFSGDPRDYSYNEQKYAAIALYNQRGYAPWPHCARSLGLL